MRARLEGGHVYCLSFCNARLIIKEPMEPKELHHMFFVNAVIHITLQYP